MVLVELVPWERGQDGRFLSRRDACAPRENQARMSVQVHSLSHRSLSQNPYVERLRGRVIAVPAVGRLYQYYEQVTA
jgi:hypothetical protein